MGRQRGDEYLTEGLHVRSEVPVVGLSGLTHTLDDDYHARENRAATFPGRW